MSSTSLISAAAANQPAASSSAAIPLNMQINQTGFLRLITAQLQDQNPLSPSDPTQFVTQLEGMSEVSSMQSMQTSMAAAQIINGTTLLGHSVLAPGTLASLSAGGSIGGAASAPAGATKLTVTVSNSHGTPVASFDVPPAGSGYTSFAWNGTTSGGGAAPPGRYAVAVSATVDGASQKLNPLVVSKVTTVSIDPSSQAVALNTDAGTVPLNAVVSVL